MSFKNLDIALSYKTKKNNPIENFFIPVLSSSVVYDVAVGYFSTNWIRDNSYGIAKFAQNGGVARWILSPVDLSDQDMQLLAQTYKEKGLTKNIQDKLSSCFEILLNKLNNDVRTALSWLIHDGIITIKFGIPLNQDFKRNGILHSKMGYFIDQEGNEVSFSGSYNLTEHANCNWERFDVYKSWESNTDKLRTEDIKNDINLMWNDQDESLAVFSPAEDVYEIIKNNTQTGDKSYELIFHYEDYSKNRSKIQIPSEFLANGKLRSYQEKAITSWMKDHHGKGIFHMATGSGKTVTALAAAVRVYDLLLSKGKNKTLVIIITVPTTPLAEQWMKEAIKFNLNPLACFGDSGRWHQDLQAALQNLFVQGEGILCIVTVNNSFAMNKMQSLIKMINKGHFLIIGDEMHNLGAASYLKVLPERANLRIGLSATPDREHDEEGTESLKDYFGEEVIEFTLNDAIAAGYLCKYNYWPVLVNFTEDEWEEYFVISKKIAQLMQIQGNKKSSSSKSLSNLEYLLFLRTRLIGKAKNKISELVKIIQEDYLDKTHMLVYCGASIEDGEKHVDTVTKELLSNLKISVNKYTSEQGKEREHILKNYEKGLTQALVAIKCLDEGVDIPRTETAFILASSSSKREFIQRRGRVLRRAKGKTIATIYDFLVVPNLSDARLDESLYNIERNLLIKELSRVKELSEGALNYGESLSRLRPVKMKYNLLSL